MTSPAPERVSAGRAGQLRSGLDRDGDDPGDVVGEQRSAQDERGSQRLDEVGILLDQPPASARQ